MQRGQRRVNSQPSPSKQDRSRFPFSEVCLIRENMERRRSPAISSALTWMSFTDIAWRTPKPISTCIAVMLLRSPVIRPAVRHNIVQTFFFTQRHKATTAVIAENLRTLNQLLPSLIMTAFPHSSTHQLGFPNLRALWNVLCFLQYSSTFNSQPSDCLEDGLIYEKVKHPI